MTKPPSSSDVPPVTELDGRGADWGLLVSRAQREEQAQHAAGAARAQGAGPALRRVVLVLLLLALAGALAVWQGLGTPAGPSPADRDQGRRALLALIGTSLADHLRVHGEYPEKLDEVLPLQAEVAYRRIEGGYELTVRLSDGTLLTGEKP